MFETLQRSPVSSLVGAVLAVGVICAWAALHAFAVWHLDAAASPLLAAINSGASMPIGQAIAWIVRPPSVT